MKFVLWSENLKKIKFLFLAILTILLFTTYRPLIPIHDVIYTVAWDNGSMNGYKYISTEIATILHDRNILNPDNYVTIKVLKDFETQCDVNMTQLNLYGKFIFAIRYVARDLETSEKIATRYALSTNPEDVYVKDGIPQTFYLEN